MTLAGELECLLEVFERERKIGFAMSALAASVRWDSRAGGFCATYLSATPSLPEVIGVREAHRFRVCPRRILERLGPCHRAALDEELSRNGGKEEVSLPYPFRVLLGTGDLQLGQGVELQWKMQASSPFGWWHGTLEALEHGAAWSEDYPVAGHGVATATITFDHFHEASLWRRLQVTFGDGLVRACAFGGYSGGLRACTAAEEQQWAHFFPSKPICY